MALRKLLLISTLLIGFNSFGQYPMTKLIAKRASGCSGLLLDCYTGAAVGVSLKPIDNDYAGSLIRVRRSSDNTESDIGVSSGNLDTAALKTFVGTGGTDDGFVTIWYDQSGNASNFTQSSAPAQPKIMDNGVVLRNTDGEVGIYFPGTTGIALDNTSLDGNAVVDIYVVSEMSDNTYMDFWGNAGGVYSFVADNGSGSTNLYGGFGTPSLYTNGTLFSGTTRGQVYTAKNGFKITTMQSAATTTWSIFKLGNYGSFEPTGFYSEMVFWTSDQSANRSGIISKINSAWSVY